ncbi:NAD(P)-dependent alcohol dehydrogenase [bacterium]|nr:NAD(P)-dependent alcohol dehydrogenase [bacterium]MBU1072784.1 NAD(P)-dependent alcohol dehydrogenase [bacterium]MBU1676034.1 NAD(P)-dependent alcohol dehydrogenase [bacterium]
MKAIVQNHYGSPDVFELREIATPVVKRDDDVLVRVHAAALHAGDYFIMRGVPYLVRLFTGWPNPKNHVPGYDVAGHVVAVGKNVTRFQPGDEVFGECGRTCAEYVCTAEDKLLPRPTSLTLEQAAAVPMSALTALHGLRDAGRVQPGHKVLINGASGGVGTFAVQIAKTFGAEVTGVCSTRNVDMVRAIGADHVIDYTEEDFTLSGHRYDLILDNVANRSFSDCRRALSPQGTLIPNSGNGGLGYIAKALLLSVFARQKVRLFLSIPKNEDLVVLKKLIEAGEVTPVIDRTYPLSQTPEAFRYLNQGHARGKVVITVE